MITALAPLRILAADDPSNVIEWFQNGEDRATSGPILEQLLITLRHSLTALVIAVAIAVPLAVVLAHYRKAEVAAAAVINVGRAIPTVAILGILVLVFLAAGQGFSSGPIVLALVLLALPPLFTNTYAAVLGVDVGAVSAARAMGFDERALMTRVELPLALPIIFTGVRIAAVQVIATEPLVAFFGGDGLGVYLRQGLGNQDFIQVQAGALLVTATAIGTDLLLYLAGRALLPRGVQRSAPGRAARHAKQPTPIPR
jgi:osmoprotectant transport system permease protein